MTDKILIDIIGWTGSICVLAAYFMISLHKVTARSKIYQALNIAGSILLIVNTFFYSAYPSTFVNIVWLLIAIFALINIYRSRNTNDNPPGQN
jgi:hypothetical protein